MSPITESLSNAPSPTQPYKVAFFSLLSFGIIAGLLCLGLQSGASSEKQAIQRVLETCDELGDEATTAGKTPGAVEMDFGRLAKKMKHVNIADCPPDFREAYIRLVGAIEMFSDVTNRYPDLPTMTLDMVFRGLSGKRDLGLTDIKEEVYAAIKDLRARENDLEAIAVRYGATLPQD